MVGGRSNFPLSHRFSSSPLQHSRYRASMWYTQLLAPSTVTTSGRPHSICRLCRPIDHLLPHLYKPNLITIQTVVSKRKVGPRGARLVGPLWGRQTCIWNTVLATHNNWRIITELDFSYTIFLLKKTCSLVQAATRFGLQVHCASFLPSRYHCIYTVLSVGRI